MIAYLRAMLADCRGATLIEYAIIALLVAIVGIIALQTLGHYASGTLSSAATNI